MSSTNKTTNYELSQYVGADKPTYLGDYNSDMLKIDTQMKTNADNISANTSAISTASETANTALTNAGTAQSTADTAVTNAGNAQTTATSALNKANANESAITTINSKFVYSLTDEIIVGTWYNGKPIYRQTIRLENTALSSGSNVIRVGDDFIPALEQLVDARIRPDGTSNSGNYNPPFYSSGSSIKQMGISYVTNIGYTVYVNEAWGSNYKYTCIFEYTKSTDIAPTV